MNEGGSPGWSLHSEHVPHGGKDWRDGGWVGPHNWSHPPVGDGIGFNEEGRCDITAGMGDTTAVQALMAQHRQQVLQAMGSTATAISSSMPVVAEPAGFPQYASYPQQPVAFSTQGMGQPLAMQQQQQMVVQPQHVGVVQQQVTQGGYPVQPAGLGPQQPVAVAIAQPVWQPPVVVQGTVVG